VCKFDYSVSTVSFLQEEEEGWKMAPSTFVPAINEGTDDYKGKPYTPSTSD